MMKRDGPLFALVVHRAELIGNLVEAGIDLLLQPGHAVVERLHPPVAFLDGDAVVHLLGLKRLRVLRELRLDPRADERADRADRAG